MAQSTSLTKWPLLALAGTLAFGLLAWKGEQSAQTGTTQQDSTPKNRQMKARSLDEVQKDLERAQKDLEQSLRQLEKDRMVPNPPPAPTAIPAPPAPDALRMEIDEAMKEINPEKLQEEMKKAMKTMETDMARMREEMARAMKDIDAARLSREATVALSKLDLDKIRKEVEAAQKQDFKELEEELRHMRPRMEESMREARKDMENARKEMQKARTELQEIRTFVDALEKEGLINTKEGYSIGYRNDQLTINGKVQPPAVTEKYRDFLNKQGTFLLKQDKEGFSLQKD